MPMLPEFEDPMARPRYTGLATFMRAPYQRGPGRRRHRADRRTVRWRGHQPHRHPARAARDPQSVLADAQDQPGERDRAVRALPGRRPGRCLGAAPVPSRELARRDRGFLSRRARGRDRAACRRAATIRSRCRSCARSPPPARSAWSTSTPIAIPARTIWARTITTARRSRARSRRGCWIPGAPSRSASAAASTTRTSGASATNPACA